MAEEDDALEVAWQCVLAEWSDPAAHKRFLVLADSTDRLAEAGRRYRQEKERDASHAVDVDARIEELLTLAMTKMKVEHPSPQATRSRVEWIAFGVSAALIAAALYQMFR